MKIMIITGGSRGDLQPLIALSVSLQNAGHEVLLCGTAHGATVAQQREIPFYAIGKDIHEFLNEIPDPATKPIQAIGYVLTTLKQEMTEQLNVLPALAEGVDLVIGASLGLGAASVADLVGAHYAFVAFCPQLVPSKYHPPVSARNHPKPVWMNNIAWWLNDKVLRWALGDFYNNERERVGLPPIDDVFSHGMGKQILLATDPEITPPPTDFNYRCIPIGYPRLMRNGTMSRALQEFLHQGAPPLYVGFGSMRLADPEKTFSLFLDVAKETGQRLVLGKGWSNLGKESGNLSDDIFVVDDCPHEMLFSQVSAIIHHGGAGTTAYALSAGKPQLIIAILADQFYWGYQIQRLNLGPKYLWMSKLNKRVLKESISQLLNNQQYRISAENFARRIDDHYCVFNAAKIIEANFQ